MTQSPYTPDDIEARYYTSLPAWFYDKMAVKVQIIESEKPFSYYREPPPTIEITPQWLGIERTPSIWRSSMVHELAHAYHFATKTITDEKAQSHFKDFYKRAKQLVEGLSEEQKNILDIKNFPVFHKLFEQNFPNLLSIEIRRYMAVAGDVFAALTRGALGFGHPKAYWDDAIRQYQEFFANSADIYFNGNPIMEHKFTEIVTLIHSFWNDEKLRS